MQKLLFPTILALTFSVGFIGCGGDDSSDALEAERAKLAEQQSTIDRIKELQLKQKSGTITDIEETELNNLYKKLESQG